MWFKNISFYHFEFPFKMTVDQLSHALEERKARACRQMELSCEGWVSPLGLDGHMLVHESNGKLMICRRYEEKVIPASLVREEVESRALELSQREGRKAGRKERFEIKDRFIQELLPMALVKSVQTYAYIDPKNSWLIVNAASAKHCDALLVLLRKTLGSLNVVLPRTELSTENVMTSLLMDAQVLSNGFAVEDECELRAAVGDQASVIRCKYMDVSANEVKAHISAGKRVHRLALSWQDKLSFVLHEDLSLRRIRYESELLEKAEGENAASQFDADFVMMASEFSDLIPALLGLFASKPH